MSITNIDAVISNLVKRHVQHTTSVYDVLLPWHSPRQPPVWGSFGRILDAIFQKRQRAMFRLGANVPFRTHASLHATPPVSRPGRA